ncbi:MAG: hypothetical protein K1X67_25985 [Fimbriimonadaceae bacterium]|nr:hypothetical protein [Fimbriimonadaceae bacterium]
MARPTNRGLPADYSLDLPDDTPVHIGDFLDEEPSFTVPPPRPRVVERPATPQPVEHRLQPEIIREPVERPVERMQPKPVQRKAQPTVIRYQLNLSPRAKTMLEELVEYVQTFSPESDARTSEVFQGIMTLLHNAKEELELAELPRRGAWGSVTAKNFPNVLSEAFEKAILKAARKRGAFE